MLLSQQDLQSASLHFDPPLTKRAANRRIFLMAAKGAILEGITYNRKKGLTIPTVLLFQNRPEWQEGSAAVQQPVSDLSREVLASRIHGELSKGVALWPNHRSRTR